MKQVYSSKTTIGLLSFCLIVSIGVVCFGAVVMIANFRTGEMNLAIIVTIVECFFLMVVALTVCVLNRAGCKILYDPDKKMLYRKGLWWGYKYELKVEDIKEIIVVFLPQDGTYYLLLDPYNSKYESYYTKSCIRLRDTKENLEFIKQFWDKPINTSEYIGNNGYTKLVTNHRTQT